MFTVEDGAGGSAGDGVETGDTRVYYIAAEEVIWDYAPSGKNLITGEDFTAQELAFIGNSEIFIGPRYKKTIYVEYTDETFTVKKPKGKKTCT